jgi:hypothetical protein
MEAYSAMSLPSITVAILRNDCRNRVSLPIHVRVCMCMCASLSSFLLQNRLRLSRDGNEKERERERERDASAHPNQTKKSKQANKQTKQTKRYREGSKKRPSVGQGQTRMKEEGAGEWASGEERDKAKRAHETQHALADWFSVLEDGLHLYFYFVTRAILSPTNFSTWPLVCVSSSSARDVRVCACASG